MEPCGRLARPGCKLYLGVGHSDDFEAMGDSLDRVERLLQIEEALLEAINADASLTASERDRLV